MEEDEYNDIVTYIQDQKYPQNANESVKRKLRKQVLWILLKHCNCNDFYIYLKNTAVIKKYFTSIKYIFICSNVN